MRTLFRLVVLYLLLIQVQCKKDAQNGPLAGKCEAVEWDDGEVVARWCAWEGYWWWCDEDQCFRKDPAPVEVP